MREYTPPVDGEMDCEDRQFPLPHLESTQCYFGSEITNLTILESCFRVSGDFLSSTFPGIFKQLLATNAHNREAMRW
jgi:hypothetical protein